MRTVTSTPASEASFLIAASRSFPKGSESYSYDRRVIFHSWKKGVNHRMFRIHTKCLKHCRLCSLNQIQVHLEKSGKDISGLASDHKQTRVELTEAGVQVFKTLQ